QSRVELGENGTTAGIEALVTVNGGNVIIDDSSSRGYVTNSVDPFLAQDPDPDHAGDYFLTGMTPAGVRLAPFLSSLTILGNGQYSSKTFTFNDMPGTLFGVNLTLPGGQVNVDATSSELTILRALSVHLANGSLDDIGRRVTVLQTGSVEVDDASESAAVPFTLHSNPVTVQNQLVPGIALDVPGIFRNNLVMTDANVAWTIDGPSQAANTFTVNATSKTSTTLKAGSG